VLGKIRVDVYASTSASLPLDGGRVDVLDGPLEGHMSATDSNGYAVLWVDEAEAGRRFTIRVSKAGYAAEVKEVRLPLPYRVPIPLPLTTAVGVYLALNNPSVVIAPGDYDLTFEFDSACTAIPEPLRRQTFPARVVEQGERPPGTMFSVYPIDYEQFGEESGFALGIAGDKIALRFSGLGWNVAPLHYFEAFPDEGLYSHRPPPGVDFMFTMQKAAYCERTTPLQPGSWPDCARTAPELLKVSARCDSPKNRVLLVRR
jgi:hypothetical protein